MRFKQIAQGGFFVVTGVLLWVSCGVSENQGSEGSMVGGIGASGGIGGAGVDLTEEAYRLCDEMCAADKVPCFPGTWCIDDCHESIWNAQGECVDELIPWLECLKGLFEKGQACNNLWCAELSTYENCLYDTGGCIDHFCTPQKNVDGQTECNCDKICNHIQYFSKCTDPGAGGLITCNCYEEEQYVGTCSATAETVYYSDFCNRYLEKTCCNKFFKL